MSRQILQSKDGSRENRPELFRGIKFPDGVRCMPLPPPDDEAGEAGITASNPKGLGLARPEAPVAATLGNESCDTRRERMEVAEELVRVSRLVEYRWLVVGTGHGSKKLLSGIRTSAMRKSGGDASIAGVQKRGGQRMWRESMGMKSLSQSCQTVR